MFALVYALPVKVALVGASGFIGSKILTEAVARGHAVTAICRHPENVTKHELVRAVAADVNDTATLVQEFQGQDAIVHSYTSPPDPMARAFVGAALAEGGNVMAKILSYVPVDPAAHDASVKSRTDQQVAATKSIIAAAKQAGVKRILAVGGAGSLLIDGVRAMDRPDFPKAFEGGAVSTAVIKDVLKHEPDIEWTVLCPSKMIAAGERTGKFRVGGDDLLVAADGSSRISLEDFAMAMIDELEQPRHTGHRFTVGY